MRSIEYPQGWFFVERAVVIMFGLSAQLAPKLNTVHVGFPYIMKFLAESRRPPPVQPGAAAPPAGAADDATATAAAPAKTASTSEPAATPARPAVVEPS